MFRFLLFVFSPLLVIALGIYSWTLHRRIIQRLRTNHAVVWESLGKPTLFDLWLAPACFWGRGYFAWLLSGSYKGCGDEELTILGNRHFDIFALLCCFLLIWPAVAWFGGYLHAR
jgi:hypothetical protein